MPNRPPKLTCGSSRSTQVVHTLCTSFSKLWKFSVSSFLFSFTCTTLSVSALTIYVVIYSCINVALFECSCTMLVFSSSIYAIICDACSWRGSNWACLYYLFIFVIFNSFYKVFISWVTFKHLLMLMVFCRCFNSYMTSPIFSYCWSNSWTFSSSSKMVQIYAVSLNNYVTSLASLAISIIWSVDCCSLFSQTSG
jgi:hypothetical protein